MVDRLRLLLFPPACVFCHAPLAHRGGCCAACHARITVWPATHCRVCGTPLPASLAPGPCGACLRRMPPFQRSESLFMYRGTVRDALLAWKLRGRDAPVRWLLETGRMCIERTLAPGDLLLPVPMPLSRMRRRGQHHAADLARWLAEISGARWDWRILRRQGAQQRQSSLSGGARWRNMRKAFALDATYLDKGLAGVRRLWIVDDIRTTGATLYYAARSLRGLRMPVGVWTLARTHKE